MGSEVSTGVAARRLGVSPSTVLNWLHDGRLAGRRGDQPQRPRWYVAVDDDGRPIRPDGVPVGGSTSDAEPAQDLARLRSALERRERVGAAREVALRLKAAGERQRRALQLQAEALNEMAAALDEQGEAIAQLLLPDTVEELAAQSAPRE